MDDEITSRLINVVKGGAYLIASSISFTGVLLAFHLSLLSAASNKSSIWFLVQGLLAGLAVLSMVVSAYSSYQLARKFLER
jgi:uncharacterized membrane protein